MNLPHTIPDELLFDFILGECSPEQAESISELAAADPELSAQINVLKGVADSFDSSSPEPLSQFVENVPLEEAFIDSGILVESLLAQKNESAQDCAVALMLTQFLFSPEFSNSARLEIAQELSPMMENPICRDFVLDVLLSSSLSPAMDLTGAVRVTSDHRAMSKFVSQIIDGKTRADHVYNAWLQLASVASFGKENEIRIYIALVHHGVFRRLVLHASTTGEAEEILDEILREKQLTESCGADILKQLTSEYSRRLRSDARDQIKPNRRQRDQLCDRFERFWRSDQRGGIIEFLSSESDSVRPGTLDELIVVEIDLKHSHGEKPDRTDYIERFPNNRRAIKKGFNRIEEERSTLATVAVTTGNEIDKSATSPSAIPPIIDQYQIIRRIGSGSFGLVYKAIEIASGELFALKFPRNQSIRSLREFQQLQAESQIAKKLDHPSIIRTRGLVEASDLIFVVQQFVNGPSLKRQDFDDVSSIVNVVLKLAQGLAYAHGNNLIHRDLKPANILMKTIDCPLITDIGLAIHNGPLGTAESKTQRFGSPAYMSPEQVMGSNQLDRRTDIWSLGVIFYELLVGERPFQGNTADETYEQVQHRKEKSLAMIRPEIAPELQRICGKCLAKRVRDRYASANDLADDLDHWLADKNDRSHELSIDLSTDSTKNVLVSDHRFDKGASAGSATEWIDDLRLHAPETQRKIWERFVDRLVNLARQKLRESNSSVVDADDIANMAFGNFYEKTDSTTGAKNRHDLWKVLALFVERRAIDSIRKESKIRFGRERMDSISSSASQNNSARIEHLVDKNESLVDTGLTIMEEFEKRLSSLNDDRLRRIAVEKMQGYKNSEIARRLNVSLRSVERKLREIRDIFEAYDNE